MSKKKNRLIKSVDGIERKISAVKTEEEKEASNTKKEEAEKQLLNN